MMEANKRGIDGKNNSTPVKVLSAKNQPNIYSKYKDGYTTLKIYSNINTKKTGLLENIPF